MSAVDKSAVDSLPEDILDISGLSAPEEAEPAGQRGARPWVGIRFDCCGAYCRVYRNQEGTAYVGRCPRCLAEVRLRVGPGGTTARFFSAE